MKRFVILYVTQSPFMGTGHLLINAHDEASARHIFEVGFPCCAIHVCLEIE